MAISPTDASDLIALAARGDEGAFARIVGAYHEDMRRVCVVVTGDDGIADEAVGRAWGIAWQKLGSVRDAAGLRPWLVSVAVNEARQLHRARRRRALVEVALEQRAGDPVSNDPASGINALDLRNAMTRLHPDDRALLAMRYLLGFTSTELGVATGRSASGTRARLARLLERLKKELGDG